MDLDQDFFQRVLDAPSVRAAVEAAGRSRLARAKYLAYKAGRKHFGDALRLEVGVRPGGRAKYGQRRPYARITASLTPEQVAEDNRRARQSRTQILRRSA